MSLLANSNAIETGGYNLQRSLRFRSSASANLTRTPSSTGNRKTWTWSAWLKRGSIAQTGTIWGSNFSSGGFGLAFGNYGGVGVNPEIMGVTLYAVGTVTTNAVFRDPSAWYHIVAKFDSTQATQANRFALYVNGVQQTLSGTLNVTLNADYNVNLSGALHVIGGESGYYNDCYLAEVNFIDGQALTPSSFGQTNAVTGVWQPKKYTGTYGTNGFYLPFSDNTSATTLAYDKSGNGNNWTPNNISTTAGATYDSMTDVPTLTSATAANYCVISPLNKTSNTIGNGNLSTLTAGNNTAIGSFGMSSGKWYWEVTCTSNNTGLGIAKDISSELNALATTYSGNTANSYGYGWNGVSPTKINNGTQTVYGTLHGTSIVSVVYDADAGSLTFWTNGVSDGVAFTGLSGTFFPTFVDIAHANFGQRPFSYTPPTGFKALNTFNLPDPTIKKPNQYMDATTYTGNGTSQTITNAAGFQPDLVWGKSRSNAYQNILVDSVRGGTTYLQSSTTAAEATNATVVSGLTSTGFSVGSDATLNGSGTSNVGWQWKKGATAGFDIVTYTGTGANRTVSHSLGVAPSMIITKIRNNTDNWAVYHKSVGNTAALFLSTTGATNTNSAFWNNTSPTSSEFTVGSGSTVNFSGGTYVAYLFAEIPGFSKFGSYTGNGSADGPFVYCGFRPKYVMVKCSSNSGYAWLVWDSIRETYNVQGIPLFPNLSNAESGIDVTNYGIDFVSNGFKIKATGAACKQSSYTYIYAAFAENPFKYSNAR